MTATHPEPGSIDSNVTGVLEILIAYRRVSFKELIVATGIGKSTMIRRRAQGGWSAAEVARLAEVLDVPISVFYEGPEKLIATSSRYSRPGAFRPLAA